MIVDAIEAEPLFSLQDTSIDAMESEYMPLVVDDVTDKQAIKQVREARINVKNARIAVEKKRKELKADALAYGQKVDAEARRIKGRLEPIEQHLQYQEDIVKREADRIAREKEEARQAMIRDRLERLAACGHLAMPADVEHLSESDFDLVLTEATERKRIADAAEAAEAKRRAEEAERLRIEREELDRQRREQEAERAKIEAEKARIAKAAAAKRRAEELEKARKEAAEKAAAEERERLAREEAAAKAEAERQAAEEKRREALRPDHVKLVRFAEQLRELRCPPLSGAAGDAERQVQDALGELQATVCGIAMKLDPECNAD